jgi:hypothetical protein
MFYHSRMRFLFADDWRSSDPLQASSHTVSPAREPTLFGSGQLSFDWRECGDMTRATLQRCLTTGRKPETNSPPPRLVANTVIVVWVRYQAAE